MCEGLDDFMMPNYSFFFTKEPDQLNTFTDSHTHMYACVCVCVSRPAVSPLFICVRVVYICVPCCVCVQILMSVS